jgi:fermentation-respiration switch protein FrsA (DUF1100 family)
MRWSVRLLAVVLELIACCCVAAGEPASSAASPSSPSAPASKSASPQQSKSASPQQSKSASPQQSKSASPQPSKPIAPSAASAASQSSDNPWASLGDLRFNPLGPLEKTLVFMPVKYPNGDWQPKGIPYVDARYPSADGTKLHSLYFPHEHPKAYILFFHGNGCNGAHWVQLAQEFHKRSQAAVMLGEYRGFGRCEGEPTEAGALADARAARKWLAQREKIAENQIIVIGQSLGGAMATDLAAKDGARGLILLSTFDKIANVVTSHAEWLPAKSIMEIKFDSISKIGNYHNPLLICHGDRDTIVPYELAQNLFKAANEPKRFVTVKGFNHPEHPPVEFYKNAAEFVRQLPY